MSVIQTVAIGLIFFLLLSGVLLLFRRNILIKARLSALEGEKRDLIQVERRLLDFLHELGLSIDRESTSHAIYKIIVEGAQKVTQATGSALYLFDQSNQSLHPAALSEHCPPLVPLPVETSRQTRDSQLRLAKISLNEGIIGHCLQEGRPLWIEDIQKHPAFQDELGGEEQKISALLAPLLHNGSHIGVLAVAREADLPVYREKDLYPFTALAEQSAFAIGNFYAHHQAAAKKRLDSELQTAQEVQRVLLPSDDPRVPGYRIYGQNLPARMISGDYYDYLPVTAQSSGVMIADVSGKGVPAGIIMASFRSCLKTLSQSIEGPAQTLTLANELIYPDIREDMFISAAYVHLEHETGQVTLARAGHNPPYHYRALHDTIEKLKPPGLAVGIDEGDVFSRILKDHPLTMESGDCLLLYTDGILEATNQAGEEFGAKRLEESFRQSVHGGAEVLVKSLIKKLRAYADGTAQGDDITLVAIEKE